MFSPPPNPDVEALTPNLMVVGERALGSKQGEMKSCGWDPHDGVSALIQRGTRELVLSVMKSIQQSQWPGRESSPDSDYVGTFI